MASDSSYRALSFRRTFALMLILVVFPAAGLSGFGVVAIINERAAVEKRLQTSWQGKLDLLNRQLIEAQKREGAEVSPAQIDQLLTELSRASSTESVHFELRPVKATKDSSGNGSSGGLVGKIVSGVSPSPPGLAERVLGPPLQDFRLVVVPMGEDPIIRASNRNRVVYAVLLVLFYGLLALGVVYTARVLYLQTKLSRLKTDFVSLVSHELKTPLTSIRMFIEMLSLGRVKDSAQAQEILALLAKESERLSNLIERVLDWGRIESGRKEYHRVQTSAHLLIEASLAALRAQRFNETIAIEQTEDPELPPLFIDLSALAGALLNLLQNAFKYSGDQKTIKIRARKEKKGVSIDVEDNGAGIPPRERKRIFDRFYRIDSLLTRKTEGSGLGLALAKRIVEAQGGKISVKSEVGKGSCFTLRLPAMKPPR